MRVAGVAGQIRRLGQIVKWYHAIPASGDRVDVIAGQPILTAGGPRVAMGPQGESYADPVLVRAFWSKKVSSIFIKQFGTLDENDAQLTVAAIYAPEPALDVICSDRRLLTAFNEGRFANLRTNDEKNELIARDKFVISGTTWIVKSRAVPIVAPGGVTVARRLLLGAMTY
jgi:hypothetical protein